MYTRRALLEASAAIGIIAAMPTKSVIAQTTLPTTPDQILGPFYPVKRITNDTGDLTHAPGRTGQAMGEVITVMGSVRNSKGAPLGGIRIEIWQANAVGRYNHPSDQNPAPLDPNFDGYGVVTSDADGRYHFKTIKPAAYPVGPNTMRPAHIHYEVVGQVDRLVTQLYFEGDPYNATDRFLQSIRRPERLIAKAGPNGLIFDLVLSSG